VRILYLITELDPGGAEKALYQLVTGLDHQRFQPEVACLIGRGEVGQWIEREGTPVHYLETRLTRLWALMASGGFDVVHTFLFHANVLGRIVARIAGVRSVVSSVRVEEPRRHHQALNTLTWRLADRIVCVSESTARFFCKSTHADAGRVMSIPNGVDASRFCGGGQARTERSVVASVGRLDSQKGYDVLIDAAKLCADRGVDAEFVIAGDGPQRQELEQKIAHHGLASKVELVGRTADVPGLLATADVFVSSSRWEGMPNAVLEAMAAGLPIVATTVGGTPEVVVHGQTGLLVSPEDARAIADAVAALISNPTCRLSLGKKARTWVLEHFTWEKNAAAFSALYDNLAR